MKIKKNFSQLPVNFLWQEIPGSSPRMTDYQARGWHQN